MSAPIGIKTASGTALGKDLSTLQRNVVFDGSEIRGYSIYQDSFEQFNSTVPEEQKGYYIAVDVTDWNGAKFRLDRTTGKGNEVAFSGDGIAILWLGGTEDKAKTAKQFVYIKGEKETKFDLNLKFRK